MPSSLDSLRGCAASGVLGMLAGLLPPAAHAEGWNGAVVLSSDRVLRGITLSNGRAALSAGMGYSGDGGWNAGLAASTPSYPQQGGHGDLTLTLSQGWQLDGDWLLLAGAATYRTLGAQKARLHSYSELSLVLGWQGRASASLLFSPDTLGYVAGQPRSGSAVALEFSVHQRLAGRLALDAGIGYQDLQSVQGKSYGYGSVGLRWGLGPATASLGWIGSQAGTRGVVSPAFAGNRWVTALVLAF